MATYLQKTPSEWILVFGVGNRPGCIGYLVVVTYRGHVSHYESEHWKRGGITAFMPPVCERQRFVIYVGLGVEKRRPGFLQVSDGMFNGRGQERHLL